MNSLILHDSILLNNVIMGKIGQQNQSSKLMAPYMEFFFNLDPFRFNGFLIVINNKMRITSESCYLFGNLFSLELNEHRTGIACSHYIVRYEAAPLHIRMMAPLFSNLLVRKLITIMITVVRFSCPPWHDYLRQCPNQPLCIPSKLFCDTMDNCGMRSDELFCPSAISSFPNVQQSLPFNTTTFYNKSDHHFHNISIGFDPLYSSPILWIFVLSTLIIILLLIFVGITIRRRQKRRWQCQESPTIRSMFINAIPFNAAGRMARQNRRSTSDGETLALLTLGLKNVLQTLPDQHWHNTDYGGTEMGFCREGKDKGVHHQNGKGLTEPREESEEQRRVHWQ